jgi:hypothetical protein
MIALRPGYSSVGSRPQRLTPTTYAWFSMNDATSSPGA